MFRFRCPKCGQTIEDPKDLTGSPCPVCGAVIGDSESALRLSPGDKIGGYEIIRLLGSGGTGNVYLALQLSMSRQIALKVLYPELTENRDSVDQFLGEVKTLGIIQHSNIVSAFDSGMDKERGLYYLAMQYIPGQPLDAIVAQSGPLPVSKALRIVENIAEALNHVWTKYQLCHRDIKPGNIMLNDDDVPMLLDFGAVLHSGENSITNGLVEGSPCFMSPEQARGEKLTFASDLYALGETLYFLIVGVAPFEDPDVREILKKQCEAPFPLPEQRAPGCSIPQEVVSFLRKTMAKSPVDRFESWESFLAELKKVKKAVSGKNSAAKGAGRPSASRPAPKPAGVPAGKVPSPNGLGAPPAKRGKSRLLLAINYLLISLLTAGAIAYMLSRSNTQSAENRMIEVRAAMKNVRENDKDPDGARDMIRRALAEIRKFGVKKEVAQAIKNECDEEIRFIESLEKENQLVAGIQETVSSLIADLRDAHIAMKRNDSKETRAELKRIRAALMEQSTKILTITFARPSNEEKMRQTVAAINSQTKVISELLEAPPAAARKTAAPPAAKKTAAAKQKAPVKDEKTRRREHYQGKVDGKKAQVARDVVLGIRKGKLEDVEKNLHKAGSGIEPAGPDCRDMEAAYKAWLNKVRGVYREAKPILKKVSSDDIPDKEKKEKISSLTEGNKKLRCHALILFGYFTDAQDLAEPDDQELLRDVSRAYLTHRLEQAIRKKNDKMLEALRKEYKKFKPYTDLEKEVRARIGGK